MKIALDAMGGDFAPEASVHGTLETLHADIQVGLAEHFDKTPNES